MYRLRTLGGAAVLRDGVLLDSFTGQRKLLALLALIAVAGQRGISRDRLAAFLWPESDMEHARGSLKQSLHVLRRQLGTADVVAGTAELRLNADHMESDVAEFMSAAEAGEHTRAADVYGGPFLDGFHLTGAPGFEQWVDEQRAVFARQHAESLQALAVAAQQRGEWGEAAARWRRLQSQDPFSARATAGLMEALDAAGERAAALRAGQAYETLVREELGTSADATVLALIQRLRATSEPPTTSEPRPPGGVPVSREPQPPRRTPVPREPREPREPSAPHDGVAVRPAPNTIRARRVPMTALAVLLVVATLGALVLWPLARRNSADAVTQPNDPSIAVIPFVNTSDNAADEHFADGLTDELISRLGRVSGLRVSARTSTFALKDRGLSARAFADTLGVAAVIEGTVRRQDDRLKITAQLVEPRDNSVLWSQSYDR